MTCVHKGSTTKPFRETKWKKKIRPLISSSNKKGQNFEKRQNQTLAIIIIKKVCFSNFQVLIQATFEIGEPILGTSISNDQTKKEKSTYKEKSQNRFKFYHFMQILSLKTSIQSNDFQDYCPRLSIWGFRTPPKSPVPKEKQNVWLAPPRLFFQISP